MLEYVGQEAFVTELRETDGAGCPIVHVDIDGGEWVWRIRDMTYSGQVSEVFVMIEDALSDIEDGLVEEGLIRFNDALALEPTFLVPAGSYNQICWFGSLWGYAAEVMFACEQAVALDPDHGGIADSRGVARALTGDFEGAIEDFRQFIEWGGDHRGLRAEWITELEERRNPFDEELLTLLRNE
jgi:hypothetical protein